MTTTTGTDLAPRLRAFKHRLDPNPAQATLLAQYAGAARVAHRAAVHVLAHALGPAERGDLGTARAQLDLGVRLLEPDADAAALG